MSLPWVEKYRPTTTDGIYGHEYILQSLNQFIATNQIPHMLFYGPPGTGKTTTALAICKQLCGSRFNALVLELNASDERGIDVVREQIKSFASTRTLYTNCTKFIILDESDKLTTDAQNALRRVLEQFSQNCRFIFICNEVQRITPAIQSRCARLRFGPLESNALKSIIGNIASSEGFVINSDAEDALITIANGDARSIINTLQALSMTCKEISVKTLYAMVGLPTPQQIEEVISELLTANYSQSFNVVDGLIKGGLSLRDILLRILPIINDGPIAQQLDKKARLECIAKIAEIEQSLSIGSNEKTQTAAFVAAMQTMKLKSKLEF